MIANLTAWLQDVMDLWPLWAAVGSLLGAWVLWSFKTWVRDTIATPLATLGKQIDRIEHLVDYHLGPNDGTTPVHKRLIALEKAHDIEHDDTEEP